MVWRDNRFARHKPRRYIGLSGDLYKIHFVRIDNLDLSMCWRLFSMLRLGSKRGPRAKPFVKYNPEIFITCGVVGMTTLPGVLFAGRENHCEFVEPQRKNYKNKLPGLEM